MAGAGRRIRVFMASFGLSNTRRAAALAVVLCALALTIAVPLRTYLSQRADIAEQQTRQQSMQRQVDALQRRNAQLQDPEQIKAEARQRLRYVMPGETPYLVQLPQDEQQPGAAQPKAPGDNGKVWYDNLWNSINK